MKLKSSQLKNNIVLLVEYYHHQTRIYYSDGHYEVTTKQILEYEQKVLNERSYKNPIYIRSFLLYPTMNQKDEECRWINLSYLEEKDEFYIHLLKERQLYQKAVKMYLKYKEKELLSVGS